MTDDKIDMLNGDDDNTTHPAPKLGELLKQAREKQGLSVAQVADLLHLRPTIVSDIEADNFDNIASVTYAKGYIKNYARIVGLNKQELDEALAHHFPVINAPTMQSFSRKTTRQARDGRLMMVTYFIIFALLALLVLWWVQKSDIAAVDLSQLTAEEVADISLDASVSPAGTLFDAGQQLIKADEIAEDVVTAEEHSAPSSSGAQSMASETNDSGTAVTETEREPASETTIDNAAPIVQTPDSSSNSQGASTASAVAMNLSDDCWIKVTDAQGKILVNGLKKAGSQLNVFGQEPFKVILGAPQSLTLSINGKNIDLAKFPKGRVARLTLTSSANL